MSEVQETPSSATIEPGEGVEECWMDFDGARMRYLRAGAGPPLILLHGLMAYSFSWRYTMPALAPYATVYAPDLLGSGFSDRPRIDHSMRATALRVLSFAERLGLSSFDLLGTSRGGAVAMCAAAESVDSHTVRRLVLVCPVNPYSAHGRRLAPFFATRLGRHYFATSSRACRRSIRIFMGACTQIAKQFRREAWKAIQRPWQYPDFSTTRLGLYARGRRICANWRHCCPDWPTFQRC